MNARIQNMRLHISALNDAGVRKTTFYPLLAESLAQTVSEPAPIRRAKAFAHLLAKVEQPIYPYELLPGSITGMWFVDENIAPYEVRCDEAFAVIDEFIKAKRANLANPTAKGDAVTFEASVYSQQTRFALMMRDHYDANIEYSQLQKVMLETRTHFLPEIEEGIIEGYEIARELERYFNYDYGADVRSRLDALPWNVSNHLDLNYQRVVKIGFGGILAMIEQFAAKADDSKREFYSSCEIAVKGAIAYINRLADTLTAQAEAADMKRAAELRDMAAVCRKVATGKPESFKEAITLVWLAHLIANIGGGSAMSFARFDQYMFPFYENDIASGAITRNEAKELLCCLWFKVNEPKMRTVQSLSLGGVTPSSENGANELTRLCLEVTAELKLPYPNVSVRLNSKLSPSWLYTDSISCICRGAGQPMLLNDDLWVQNLTSIGYPPEIAREFYNMGCVEIMIQGKQGLWTGGGGLTFPAIIDKVFAGWKSGKYVLDTFVDFLNNYIQEMEKEIEENNNHGIENMNKIYNNGSRDPFASAMVEGCLESGTDIFCGASLCGATIAMGGSGLGTAADSLSAIKRFVYDEGKLTILQMYDALQNNFKGSEPLRAMLNRFTPAFGNDDDTVDDIAAAIFNAFANKIHARNKGNTYRDPKFVNVLFSYNSHVYIGEVTGATPNGRLRGETLSDAIGPSQGKDTGGPTKLINSILKLDNTKVTGAFALNLKLNPSLVKGTDGENALGTLVKAYFAGGGPQLQVNFVDAEVLKLAQKEPDKYRDIVVRIAGYCEYFVNLDVSLQNEIIQRTSHAG